MKKAPRVTLYSSANCPHCRQLKQYLKNRQVRFTEADISRNQRAWREFQRLGARGVPVTLVGDTRIDGFQPEKLAKILAAKGLLSS